MRHLLALPLVALLCAACASSSPTAKVGDAVATPLKDLNVVHVEIPALLQAAKDAPYAPPADRSCAGLAKQVKALDELLGPDLDAPAEPKPGQGERALDAAGNALVHAAESAVPFRGWLRKLSGAERQSRRAQAATEAGEARRAFLRGMAVGQSC